MSVCKNDPYNPVSSLRVSIFQMDNMGMCTNTLFIKEPAETILESIKHLVRLGLELGLGPSVDMAVIQARQRHEDMERAREAYKRHRSLPPLENLIDDFKDAPPEVEVCGVPTAKT